jgi:hypothetical protein
VRFPSVVLDHRAWTTDWLLVHLPASAHLTLCHRWTTFLGRFTVTLFWLLCLRSGSTHACRSGLALYEPLYRPSAGRLAPQHTLRLPCVTVTCLQGHTGYRCSPGPATRCRTLPCRSAVLPRVVPLGPHVVGCYTTFAPHCLRTLRTPAVLPLPLIVTFTARFWYPTTLPVRAGCLLLVSGCGSLVRSTPALPTGSAVVAVYCRSTRGLRTPAVNTPLRLRLRFCCWFGYLRLPRTLITFTYVAVVRMPFWVYGFAFYRFCTTVGLPSYLVYRYRLCRLRTVRFVGWLPPDHLPYGWFCYPLFWLPRFTTCPTFVRTFYYCVVRVSRLRCGLRLFEHRTAFTCRSHTWTAFPRFVRHHLFAVTTVWLPFHDCIPPRFPAHHAALLVAVTFDYHGYGCHYRLTVTDYLAVYGTCIARPVTVGSTV